MMFYFQSGQLGHSTNTIILKSNEHKSYASLNVLSLQDSETRPGEFVIFMLSITIEKEDFAFIKPDGIHIQAVHMRHLSGMG
jgi:hypothetical protein